jgi:hypothetical protein
MNIWLVCQLSDYGSTSSVLPLAVMFPLAAGLHLAVVLPLTVVLPLAVGLPSAESPIEGEAIVAVDCKSK